MAQLPGGNFLIQQIGAEVVVFDRYTEQEVVRFNPLDPAAIASAQQTISTSHQLNDEEKCFAHFWSGYFYAHAPNGGPTYTMETL